MINYTHLKPLTTRFSCEVPGLDTEKIYLTNGVVLTDHTEKQRGVSLHLGGKQSSLKPVQIINVREGSLEPEASCENSIVVSAGFQATVIICDHTATDFHFVSHTLNHICIEEDAHLDVLMMQSEHNSSAHTTHVKVRQAPRSSFSCTALTLHGGLINNCFEVDMEGEGAECTLNGLFLCDGNQRITNTVRLRHATPECKSKQLFKGLLDDHATGFFNGHIFVDRQAQKTEAFQANHNILLSHAAKMYIQPHLEIYADDVRCSHGATIGRIDEDALFYLRSRGISLAESRFLQQFAFAHDIIERIRMIPLQERIANLVSKRLRGELHMCDQCACHCC